MITLTVCTCSSLDPSGFSLKSTSAPPELVLGESIMSLAVPTTTYHSVSARDVNVHTATLNAATFWSN